MLKTWQKSIPRLEYNLKRCTYTWFRFSYNILLSLNVCPELAQEVYAAIKENRLADAQLAQRKLTQRFNEGGTALKAEFNKINGDFECGPARKPLLNLNKK